MPATMDDLTRAQRQARCVDLRRQRLPWDTIGKELGVSKTRAHQIYREALDSYPVSALAEHRHEELELIDQAMGSLLAIAGDDREWETDDGKVRHAVSPRTRVEAWSAVRGWSEHRARLLGLNAPTKSQVDVVAYDGFTAQLERLRAELGEAGNPALEAVDAEEVTEAEVSAAEVEALQIEGPGKDA